MDDFFSEEEEGDDNDALALTPRPFKRGTMPSSRSTPSIPSASMNASASMSSALNSRLSRDGRKDDSRQCTTCRRSHKEWQIQRAGDGQVFCRPCYADRFLPKCRKCTKAIEGGAVTSSDGKVTGKVGSRVSRTTEPLADDSNIRCSITLTASRASCVLPRSRTRSSTSCESSLTYVEPRPSADAVAMIPATKNPTASNTTTSSMDRYAPTHTVESLSKDLASLSLARRMEEADDVRSTIRPLSSRC